MRQLRSEKRKAINCVADGNAGVMKCDDAEIDAPLSMPVWPIGKHHYGMTCVIIRVVCRRSIDRETTERRAGAEMTRRRGEIFEAMPL